MGGCFFVKVRRVIIGYIALVGAVSTLTAQTNVGLPRLGLLKRQPGSKIVLLRAKFEVDGPRGRKARPPPALAGLGLRRSGIRAWVGSCPPPLPLARPSGVASVHCVLLSLFAPPSSPCWLY